MRVPLSWLADYVPLTLPPEALAARLTMAGVETTYEPGASATWDKVRVGHVVDVAPHPNADRLRLATVDLGGETATVVCGAPNVAPGQRIAFAGVGANLIDGKTGERSELRAATIRGVVSAGMVCSVKELGLGDEHDGILVLPEDAPVGVPLAEYMPDDVLDIEVTPNRGDCLSVLGIAREVAAITRQMAAEPPSDYDEGDEPINDAVRVQIADPDLCSRYTATVVRGVRIGPSPAWMRRRLELAGQRAINNVVDVTNYVMLEYGQPLHAFDLSAFADRTVVVRPATDGERFTTLDGAEHELRRPMLLIADPERAVGLAGVMGGQNSEMHEGTTDVLLESATFNALNTRRTANALHLRTEASLRFEKGLNPELAVRAVRRATRLILETAGGTASAGVSDSFPERTESNKMLFTNGNMRRVLGADFPHAQVIEVLRALGFTVDALDEDKLLVRPPYWRSDIAIEEDIIEEVARTIGYDAVPERPLAGQVPSTQSESGTELREEVRDLLVQGGLQETISYSLVSLDALRQEGSIGDGRLQPLRVANPMSREQEYLRLSLRGSLLRAAAAALRQPPGNVALFEVGRVFLRRDGDLPEEREIAAGVIAGPQGNSLWETGLDVHDFFEAKGMVQVVLDRLGVRASFVRAQDDLLHPGRTARVLANGRDVGVVGELHPQAVARFDLPIERVALFELDLASLSAEAAWRRHRFESFSRYPVASRDLALAVDADAPAERLQAIIDSHPLVARSTLFDVFTGEGLEPGKKSLAYRVDLQSPDGTLSPEQITEAVAAIVADLERTANATLRA